MKNNRVILLEDDEMVRSLVICAVDEMDIDLVLCDDATGAMRELELGQACLLVTDLMLPGESGAALIRRYAAAPFFDPELKIAVFSAGLNPAVRREMGELPVWRLMSKPASIADIRACFRDGTAGVSGEAAVPSSSSLSQAQKDAQIMSNFQNSCLAQFPADVVAGDSAWARSDFAALRRMGHNIKSVMRTLGHGPGAEAAARLETAAASAAADAVGAEWTSLRAQMKSFGTGAEP